MKLMMMTIGALFFPFSLSLIGLAFARVSYNRKASGSWVVFFLIGLFINVVSCLTLVWSAYDK